MCVCVCEGVCCALASHSRTYEIIEQNVSVMRYP